MKKIIGIITALALILSCVPVFAEGCTISADSSTATENGTAVVTIKIENNPGMAIGKVKLNFDKTKLMPVGASKGDVLQNAYSFTSNLDDESIDAAELDFVTITWMNMADITGDGTLATVEFAVVGEQTGDTDIGVEVSELANAMQADISAAEVNGKVSFGGGDSGGDTDNDGIELGISSSTVTRSGSNISGSMDLSVYSPEEETAAFIFAIFDGTGRLTAVKVKDKVHLNAGANTVPLDEISATVSTDKACAVKVYMWGSIDGMRPLTSEPITQIYR